MWLSAKLASRLMFCALETWRLGTWVTRVTPSSSTHSSRSRQITKLLKQMLEEHSVTTSEKSTLVMGTLSTELLKVRSSEQMRPAMSYPSTASSSMNLACSPTSHSVRMKAVYWLNTTISPFLAMSLGVSSGPNPSSISATTKPLQEAVDRRERQKALVESSSILSQRAIIWFQREAGTACRQCPPPAVSESVLRGVQPVLFQRPSVGQVVWLQASSTSELPMRTLTVLPSSSSQKLSAGRGSGSLSYTTTFSSNTTRSPQSQQLNSQSKTLPENHRRSSMVISGMAVTASPLCGKPEERLTESPTLDSTSLNWCCLLLSAVARWMVTFQEYSSKVEGVLPKTSWMEGDSSVALALQVRQAEVGPLTSDTRSSRNCSSTVVHTASSPSFSRNLTYSCAPEITWLILNTATALPPPSSSRLTATCSGSTSRAKFSGEKCALLSGSWRRYWRMFSWSKWKVQVRLLRVSKASRQGGEQMREQLRTRPMVFLVTRMGSSVDVLFSSRTVRISSHCRIRKASERQGSPLLKCTLCGAKYPQGQVRMLRLSRRGQPSSLRSQMRTSLMSGSTTYISRLQISTCVTVSPCVASNCSWQISWIPSVPPTLSMEMPLEIKEPLLSCSRNTASKISELLFPLRTVSCATCVIAPCLSSSPPKEQLFAVQTQQLSDYPENCTSSRFYQERKREMALPGGIRLSAKLQVSGWLLRILVSLWRTELVTVLMVQVRSLPKPYLPSATVPSPCWLPQTTSLSARQPVSQIWSCRDSSGRRVKFSEQADCCLSKTEVALTTTCRLLRGVASFSRGRRTRQEESCRKFPAAWRRSTVKPSPLSRWQMACAVGTGQSQQCRESEEEAVGRWKMLMLVSPSATTRLSVTSILRMCSYLQTLQPSPAIATVFSVASMTADTILPFLASHTTPVTALYQNSSQKGKPSTPSFLSMLVGSSLSTTMPLVQSRTINNRPQTFIALRLRLFRSSLVRSYTSSSWWVYSLHSQSQMQLLPAEDTPRTSTSSTNYIQTPTADPPNNGTTCVSQSAQGEPICATAVRMMRSRRFGLPLAQLQSMVGTKWVALSMVTTNALQMVMLSLGRLSVVSLFCWTCRR